MKRISHRQYLFVMVALAGVSLLLLAGFNLLMDPVGAFHIFSDDRLTRAAAGLTSRDGRGEALTRPGWQVVLIGNSRVYMGLDPRNPVFAGLKTYNAGLGGAAFPELRRSAEMALALPTVERLIIAVDLYEFDADQPPVPDTERSLINPNINRIDYRLSTLLGAYATGLSWQTAKTAWNHQPGEDSPEGFFTHGEELHGNGWRDWVMGGFYAYTIPKEARTDPTWKLSDAYFQSFTVLLDDAARRGVRAEVVQLPMHFIAMERFTADGKWPLYVDWLTRLTAAVEQHNRAMPDQAVTLWDFCEMNSYTREPFPGPEETSTHMEYFWDAFHFKKPLGDLVLERMIGGESFPEAKGLGSMLSSESLPEHLMRIRQDAAEYAAKNPLVQRVIKEVRELRASGKEED